MHLDNEEFVVTKVDLAALLGFASRDADREFLTGVWFDVSRSRAYSSDGSSAVVAQCRGDSVSADEPRMVPWVHLDDARRALGRGVLRVRFLGTEAGATALGAGDRPVLLTIDGSPSRAPYALPVVRCPALVPPPIDEVMPRLDPTLRPRTPRALFDARLLSRVALLGAVVERSKAGRPVEFWLADDTRSPSVMVAQSDAALWSAAVMPINDQRQPLRPSADEAVQWAATVLADEADMEPHDVATTIRAAIATHSKSLPAKPTRTRRRRKRGHLEVV